MSAFSTATLYYWNMKARNYHIQVVAKAGGIPLTLVSEFDMPALKPTLPFGQLPYLVDGDVKIAQSNAIVRYIAKKANLEGDNDLAFADSEMMIEETEDIMKLLIKAYYHSGEREHALNDFFAAGSPLHVQLGYLERKHPGDGPYFKNTPGAKRVAGAYAIACILDILVNLEPTLLDGYPKLKSFLSAMLASPAFDGLRELPMYYKRHHHH